jgi:AcrR family transcriptional regulator
MAKRRGPIKSLREENVAATRAHILAAARKHFARHGFSQAEIARIAAEARVTTGAVYHHFASKKDLFRAVAEDMEGEILAQAGATDDPNPWRRLRLGFDKLIDFCAAADVQRIIFVEAPQVIGPEAWREIEGRYAFGALQQALPALIAAGIVKPYPIDLIARMLLALLRETSAEVARTKRDPKVRALVSELASSVFDALARN